MTHPYERLLAEQQPVTRRRLGVYYTPDDIVDYIVRQTVAEGLKTKDRRLETGDWRLENNHQSPITIVDPACGAGAFLVRAYDYLLRWHTDHYLKLGPQRHPQLVQAEEGTWQLTPAERQRILITHIYGVDIDAQAVHLTRQALLTRLFNAGAQLDPRDTAATIPLPDLSANIRVGNALTPLEFDGITPGTRTPGLNWEVAFPSIMAAGGFDVIIGNPPYVSFYARESRKPPSALETHLASRYADSVGGRRNLYLFFLALALRLRRPSGYLGMIVPDTLCVNISYCRTRLALEQAGLISVDRLDFPLFDGATVRACIPIVGPRQGPTVWRAFTTREQFSETLRSAQGDNGALYAPVGYVIRRPLDYKSSGSERDNNYYQWRGWFFGDAKTNDLLNRVWEKATPLGSLADIRDGVNPGPSGFRQRIINPASAAKPTWRTVIEGRHITRYVLSSSDMLIDYDPTLLTPTLKRQGASFRRPSVFAAPKLVSRQTADQLIFALDEVGVVTLNSAHNTHARDGQRTTLLYLLALLNSRLINYVYRAMFQETRAVFPQVHIAALRQLPIVWPNEQDHKATDLQRLLGELIQQRLQPDLSASQNYAIEASIDEVIYRLYGLSVADIVHVKASLEVPESGFA